MEYDSENKKIRLLNKIKEPIGSRRDKSGLSSKWKKICVTRSFGARKSKSVSLP